MKILINGQPLLEPAGGVKTYTLQLLTALRRITPSVQIKIAVGGRIFDCPEDLMALQAPSTTQNPKVRTIRAAVPLPMKIAAKSAMLRYQVKSLKDYIYHEPNHLLHRWPLRSVLTIHDLTCLTLPQFHPVSRVALFRKQLSASIRRASAIITVSEAVREEILEAFSVPVDRVHAIPLGVCPLTISHKRQRQILSQLGIDGPYFLSVGALEPRKNLALVARCAMALRASGKEFIVVHVGPHGWNHETEVKFIGQLVEQGVWRQLAVVTDEMLWALYAQCVSLLFPSHAEGFGLPPLEAMSAGAPAIVSDIPVHREVLGEAALYCDANSEESLKLQMLRMLDQPSVRQGYVRRGINRSSQYTWDRTAAKTVEVYSAITH